MFIKTVPVTRNRRPLSVVQVATRRAHVVRVRSTPTPDVSNVVVCDEVYLRALHFHHGVRFQGVV